MDRGWSLKTLHRLIVDSATYRQSPGRRPSCYARDPYNRLLARGPAVPGRGARSSATSPWRPAACSTRRSAGPSVFAARARRSCSCRRRATARSPGRRRPGPTATAGRSTRSAAARCPTRCSQTFDAPNGDVVVRPPAAVEHAAAGPDDAQRAGVPRVRPGPGARRSCEDGGRTDAERLDLRLPPLPGPDADRRRSGRCCSSCWSKQSERFADGRAEPAGAGRRRPSEPPDAARRASRRRSSPAWTVVARVLLNLDETITKE